MSKIKHISFDFWDTLFTGNKNFRLERKKYLIQKYHVSEEQIQSAVNLTKKLCDGTGETTLSCIDAKTQAYHLLNYLEVPSANGALELAQHTHYNFIENTPNPLFNPEDLVDLKRKGMSLSISCNTGLIAGVTLMEFLKKTGYSNLFDYCLFSDIIGYFKPNPLFMELVVNHPNCSAANPSEVLHIGDNPITDGLLAKYSGSSFLLVEKGSRLDINKINNLI